MRGSCAVMVTFVRNGNGNANLSSEGGYLYFK